MKTILKTFLVVFVFGIFASSNHAVAKNVELLGAGATFPYPLYSKMFDSYNKLTGVKVNYQSIGSGGGVRQIISKTVDFGASDAFMNEKEIKLTDPIIHIPTCLGADVITYNLPGNPELKLTPHIIADIFLGYITKWNDKRIKKINPKVKLPNMKIFTVHRSDGSGTTYIFSDYLSKISKTWEKKVGRGKSLKWPNGLGGKGNEGVAGLVQQTPGSIGYVELIYAESNDMPYALIKNQAGNYIKPTIESVSLAANTKLPDDTRISLTNTTAKDGYPISSFTWLLLYKELNTGGMSKAKAKELMRMVWWMIHDGQKYSKKLHYAPLPKEAVTKAEALLNQITYKNQKIEFQK